MKHKYVIIVAGGKGLRMGTEVPKQFLLLEGKPVLMHTIRAFYDYDPAIRIVLVLPEIQQPYWKTLCKEYSFDIGHEIANGGDTRFHSVKNGLKRVLTDSLVAVHDGVRPLVDKKIIAAAFEAAEIHKAAYPVIPVVDTLRKKVTEGRSKKVDRSKYCLVQTPQVFISKVIISAYEMDYSENFTDDISVVEARKNCKPVMIEGSRENIKITTPVDLAVAEALLKCRT
ncbi:MAG: 2-C-methyl-D-erythritol 4-phosphate cytidylyltransferase [Bacteroidales bacterium]|nr:2-C-methyl-D-erythritol 4-phosphate cytidylyltransferase [Bacteroidales bacterium]